MLHLEFGSTVGKRVAHIWFGRISIFIVFFLVRVCMCVSVWNINALSKAWWMKSKGGRTPKRRETKKKKDGGVSFISGQDCDTP